VERLFVCLSILFSLLFLFMACDVGAGEREPLPARETLRRWMAEMKISPRVPSCASAGFVKMEPFIRPKNMLPRPGRRGAAWEWTERVVLLRSNAYFIANVLPMFARRYYWHSRKRRTSSSR